MSLFEEQEMATMEMIDVKSHKREVKRKFKNALRQEKADDILNDLGGVPKKGECYSIWQNGGYDTICYLKYLVDKLGVVDELLIATWIMNRENAKIIFDYLDAGIIKDMTLVISNRTRQLRKQDWGFLIEGFKSRNVKIRVPHSHAKLFTMSSIESGNYITVEGSGNFNENKRIENFTVSNDKELFDFNKSVFNEILNV